MPVIIAHQSPQIIKRNPPPISLIQNIGVKHQLSFSKKTFSSTPYNATAQLNSILLFYNLKTNKLLLILQNPSVI